jgi:hypothetical protein
MNRLNASHHRNDALKKSLVFLSACVLAACGGGGAGGSSTNQGITPAVPAAVVPPIVEPVTAQSLMKSLNAQLLLQKQTTTQHI